MKKHFALTLSFCLFYLFLCTSHAQSEFKIATIDTAKILTDSKIAKERREQIDDKLAASKSKIEDKQKELIELQEKIADSKDVKKLDKFEKDRKELERFIQDSREEIGRQIEKIGKELTSKALELVKEYAKAHKIDMVIDSSEKLRSPVLYKQQSIDITEAILERMDE